MGKFLRASWLLSLSAVLVIAATAVMGSNTTTQAAEQQIAAVITVPNGTTIPLPLRMEGYWESENPNWGGDLTIRKQRPDPNNPRVFLGEIEFDNSNESCWWFHPFTGGVSKSGELTITTNLGGQCGVVTIRIPAPTTGVWKGTYDAQFPDSGTVKLSPD